VILAAGSVEDVAKVRGVEGSGDREGRAPNDKWSDDVIQLRRRPGGVPAIGIAGSDRGAEDGSYGKARWRAWASAGPSRRNR